MEINFLTSVCNGNIKKIHELLENGIDPNLNENGYTPLTVALNKSNIDLIELLLRYGAEPNIPNSYGLTALVKSTACGYSEIVEILLDHGANPNLFSNGYSALIEASYHGYCNIIKILLNYGADINITNNRNETSLISAVDSGHIDVIKLLIKKGINPLITNNYNQSALDYAKIKENYNIDGASEMVELLEHYTMVYKLQCKCHKNIKYKKNKTILAYKNLAMCKLFEMYEVDEPLYKIMRKSNIVSVYG
jgi:ankyrin repeat protein